MSGRYMTKGKFPLALFWRVFCSYPTPRSSGQTATLYRHEWNLPCLETSFTFAFTVLHSSAIPFDHPYAYSPAFGTYGIVRREYSGGRHKSLYCRRRTLLPPDAAKYIPTRPEVMFSDSLLQDNEDLGIARKHRVQSSYSLSLSLSTLWVVICQGFERSLF